VRKLPGELELQLSSRMQAMGYRFKEYAGQGGFRIDRKALRAFQAEKS
jgi:hypothetical protein